MREEITVTHMKGGRYVEKTVSRIVGYGLLGGIVGAAVMGGVAYMMPVPGAGGAPFFVAAAAMMGFEGMALAAGWLLHLLIGATVGGLFGAAIGGVKSIGVTSRARGLGLGVAAGLVVWLVFFIPIMVSLMPTLMSMESMIVGSLVAHLIYGAILGGVVAGLTLRTPIFVCEVCGASFTSRQRLTAHGEEHMETTQQHRCEICGAEFTSKGGLSDHVEKEHTQLQH